MRSRQALAFREMTAALDLAALDRVAPGQMAKCLATIGGASQPTGQLQLFDGGGLRSGEPRFSELDAEQVGQRDAQAPQSPAGARLGDGHRGHLSAAQPETSGVHRLEQQEPRGGFRMDGPLRIVAFGEVLERTLGLDERARAAQEFRPREVDVELEHRIVVDERSGLFDSRPAFVEGGRPSSRTRWRR